MLPKVPIYQVPDQATQQAISILTNNLNTILSIPMLDGREVKGIFLKANTPTDIDHKLARQYLGYLITKISASAVAVVWSHAQDKSHIYLQLTSSADCTVDLWVY